jgi:hypothetical protein
MQTIMKKVVTILASIGSLILILSSFHLGQAITMFLLAGVIPGTDYIVSPSQMFFVIAMIAGFAAARMVTPSLRRLIVKR